MRTTLFARNLPLLLIVVFALINARPSNGSDEEKIAELAAQTSELVDAGKLDEALESARDCLKLTRTVHGNEHAATVQAMNLLAAVYLRAERFENAEALLKEALRISDKQFGPEADSTLESLEMLEFVYTAKLRGVRKRLREGMPMTAAMDPDRGDDEITKVDVYYGTDRNETDSDVLNEAYGMDRGTLQYGKAVVSIPKNHTAGIVERPKWYKFQFSENPEKHVMIRELVKIDNPSVFFSTLDGLDNSEEALLFVHGFNVKFDDAIRRAAQISYDLDFNGVSLAYSWPSQGSARAYTIDKGHAEWAFPNLAKFLTELSSKGNFERIHILAHSMGTRVLCKAIKEARANGADLSIANIILAAPDIDSQVFKEQLFDHVNQSTKRLTVYASSDDAALKVSSKINGFTRLGLTKPNIVVIPAMDTVNATGIDTSLLGHSYYGNEKLVMDDILKVVIEGLGPNRRKLKTGPIGEWLFPKLAP